MLTKRFVWIWLIILAAGGAAQTYAAGPEVMGAPKAAQSLGLVLSQEAAPYNEHQQKLSREVLVAATAAFTRARRFQMAERAKLDKVFSEKSLQEFLDKGPASFSDIVGVDLLGVVDYTVEEKTTSEGRYTVYFIEVRLIDTRTGAIMVSLDSEKSGFGSGGARTIRAAGEALSENVRQAFPPIGYVVQLDEEEVVVDLGTAEGVKKGDILQVVREGEQLIHPVTGAPLPRVQEVIATLKVRDVTPALSRCRLKDRRSKGESAQIAVGDRVRFHGDGMTRDGFLEKTKNFLFPGGR